MNKGKYNNLPNLVLITTDQHRGDHLGLAGHPIVKTPYKDSFIDKGAYFPNAYTEIPSTGGAHRCIISGRGSYYCGAVGGFRGSRWEVFPLLSEKLASAGYHCFNVGWRGLSPSRKLYGFHNVVTYRSAEEDNDYLEWLREKLGPDVWERALAHDVNSWIGHPWELEERFHPTVWTTNTSLELIRKRDPHRPFFIWISYMRPHSPYDPPRSYWDMYIEKQLPEIPVGDWVDDWAKQHNASTSEDKVITHYRKLTEDEYQRSRAGYMGSCTHVDHQLGYLMKCLKRMGLLNNTLFLCTADHGDMMGDHHMHRKSLPYEGSVRIPFVLQYPDGWDLPTGEFKQVVGLQDIMPTLLEAAGISIPEEMTGRSVFDAIKGEKWREFVHGEHANSLTPMQYLTNGREKYIYYPLSGLHQFFDLAKDRQELHNLADNPAYQRQVSRWRQRLIQILAEREDELSDGKELKVVKKPWITPLERKQ